MASSSSLIKYDHKPGQTFFLCRQCGTHIVLKEANIFTDPVNLVGLFENGVVNVKVSEEEKKWNSASCTYVEVSCLSCQAVLGQQMVSVEKEDSIAEKGRYCMFMNKLISKNLAVVDEKTINQEPVNESKNSDVVDEKQD